MNDRLNSHHLNKIDEQFHDLSGYWWKDIEYILEEFEKNDINSVKIENIIQTFKNNDDIITSAMSQNEIVKGNDVLVSKRGDKRNIYRLNDYIQTSVFMKGKDPFTLQNFEIENIARINGGSKRNYSNLKRKFKEDIRNIIAVTGDTDKFFYVLQNTEDILKEHYQKLEHYQKPENLTTTVNKISWNLSFLNRYIFLIERAEHQGFHFHDIKRFLNILQGLVRQLSVFLNRTGLTFDFFELSAIVNRIKKLQEFTTILNF